MQRERAFYSGAKQGMVIGGALAFAILLIATRNILISLYAVKTVALIVMCVTAAMVLAGWELGVSESTAMVIIIGPSVDYVVHLAAHYVHSRAYKRSDKADSSISAMGVSIFSGAATTSGSAVFLYFGTLLFFRKFSVIIILTVLFSVSYSLVYYLAFMHALGPQGKQGDIPTIVRACVKAVTCCKKQK